MTDFIFLNLDVDLISDEPLDVIANDLGDSVSIMFIGHYDNAYRLSLEHAAFFGTPDYMAEQFVILLTNLGSDAASMLTRCASIDFNFGFEGNSGSLEEKLSSASVSGISKLNASISITLYSRSS